MKRLVILLTLALLMSCVCTPQLDDQTIYLDDSCKVELPDYRPLVKAQDNCDIVSLEQDPVPGTIFNFIGVVPAKITATDLSGNVDSANFHIFLIDTIPPKIILDTSAVAHTPEQQDLLFTLWYNSVKYDMYNTELPDSIYIDELESWMPLPNLKTIFDTKNMVTVSTPEGNHLTRWK